MKSDKLFCTEDISICRYLVDSPLLLVEFDKLYGNPMTCKRLTINTKGLIVRTHDGELIVESNLNLREGRQCK